MRNQHKLIDDAREDVNVHGQLNGANLNSEVTDAVNILISEMRDSAEEDHEEARKIIAILSFQLRGLTSNDNAYGERCECCDHESSISFKRVSKYLKGNRENNYYG